MKVIIISLIFILSLKASILDEYYIFQAQKNYKKNQFEKSIAYYKKIENKSSKIYYNMGNISYKLENYSQAIKYYENMKYEKSKKINHKKFHNMANAYMKINNIKKAKNYYQKALKIKKHPITIKNLHIANKMLLLALAKKKNKFISGTSNEGQIELSNTNPVSKEGNDDNNVNTLIKNRSGDLFLSKNLIENIQLKKFKDANNQTQNTKQNSTSYFSQLEERKWDNILKKRKMNTLLIPLDIKGEVYEDITKPW